MYLGMIRDTTLQLQLLMGSDPQHNKKEKIEGLGRSTTS
jgi:hypothetical protein